MKTPKAPRMKLYVTEEIIATAIPRDSNHCMFADAIKAARPDLSNISVDLGSIRCTDRARGLRYTYMTPRIAQICLVNFDNARKPLPFDFMLRNGQVTKSGNTKTPRKMTEHERAQRSLNARKMHAKLKRARLVQREPSNGTVADRVGGRTPPLQKGSDGVPFSRRRAFGLRALEF